MQAFHYLWLIPSHYLGVVENNRMGKVSRTKYVFHTIYFGIIYTFTSGLKWKKKKTSWKYLHDNIYHRAHDSVYLKKSKFKSSICLTIYSDNYQNIYVYSCIKILSGIKTSMNITIDNNWKHLQCKFKVVSITEITRE